MNPLAWHKLIEQENGVIVGYWLMKSMNVNMLTALAQVSYDGYLSQEAFEAGKPFIVSQSCTIDFSGFDPEGQLAAGVVAMVQAAQGE